MAMPFWLKSSPRFEQIEKAYLPSCSDHGFFEPCGQWVGDPWLDLHRWHGIHDRRGLPSHWFCVWCWGCAGRGHHCRRLRPEHHEGRPRRSTAEMQRVMAALGLEAKQVPGTEAQGSEPPAGFVPAAVSEPAQTLHKLEQEVLCLIMDKDKGTYLIEGWETVIRPLPESSARFARVITHGNWQHCSLNSKVHHGRQLWWRRSWRSMWSPNARQSTRRCGRWSTHRSVVDPWTPWMSRTRGRRLLWSVRIAMHHGEPSRNVSCARAPPPLTWPLRHFQSLRLKGKLGNCGLLRLARLGSCKMLRSLRTLATLK